MSVLAVAALLSLAAFLTANSDRVTERMKRFLISLATFSLIETIGRHPAVAGILMLLGVGGGAGIALLTTPTITPSVSSNFNTGAVFGNTLNALKPNGGTAGATLPPISAVSTGPTGSFGFYTEMVVDPNLGYTNQGFQVPFVGMSLQNNGTPGQPKFAFERSVNGGIAASQWMNSIDVTGGSNISATPGSNYATGFYPFTATGGGCAVEPTGIWVGSAANIVSVAPGQGCSFAPTFSALTVPGAGAQQHTGLASPPTPLAATTCVSNLPVSGEMTVTANVAVAHGLTPGQTYTMQGFTGAGFTGYNATYIALPGTTGTTLVGETQTGAGTCPTSPLDTSGHEGTALSGVSATYNYPVVSASNPFSGGTGITTKNGQHICSLVGEYGDDSPSPGFQFVAMTDDKGVSLPGSPSLVTNPNQGTANFTGWTTASSNILNVSSMTAYTTTGTPTWALGSGPLATTGLVTFTVTANPGYIPGSEFTVTGMSPSSVNGTYIAVKGTSSTTLVGNQLTAAGGVPQALAHPGAISGTGTIGSVIFPGMQLLGSTPASSFVLPYGTAGSTGTGSNGSVGTPATYVLSATQTAALGGGESPGSTLFAWQGYYFSAATGGSGPGGSTLTVRSAGIGSDFVSIFGHFSTTLGTPNHLNWGGSLGNFAFLNGVIPPQTGGAPSTTALASLCTKTTDVQSFAKAQTAAGNPMNTNSFYRMNDPGIWGDSGNATITGHITNTGTNATLVVDSTTFGSLALGTGTQTAYVTGAGLPLASPITISLATTCSPGTGPLCVGATYLITPNTTPVLGSSGSPVTFAVGAYKPALPVQANTMRGYIDTTAGLSTLHVTTLDDGSSHTGFASFTGTLSTDFTGSVTPGTGANGAASGHGLLFVSSSTNAGPYIGAGTIVSPAVGSAGGTFSPSGTGGVAMTVLGPASAPATPIGAGFTGYYEVSVSQTVSSQLMFGSGVLPGPATILQESGTIVGNIPLNSLVTDGGVSLTGPPLLVLAWLTTIPASGNNYYSVGTSYTPAITGDTTMIASATTLVPGEYIQNSTATNQITNPVKVVSYTGACGITGAYNGGPGCYSLSASPNSANAVGSSGTVATFFGTTITDGAAIAPGIALTVRDQGTGATFPLTNLSTKVGTVALSGTYDAPTLGGTPSGIQVMISNSFGGPALTGCTPCNWGTMTSTIAGGTWKGTIAGIPGGGPYSVSVRASNGTAYATLPSTIKVGLLYAIYGQGQTQGILSSAAGSYTSSFSGLWGLDAWATSLSAFEIYVTGPPITADYVPAQTVSKSGDRFGVVNGGSTLPEGDYYFDQTLTNAFGVPTTILNATRDGIGAGIMALGNVAQSQTIGAGDGSSLTWCSATIFCPHVDVGRPLLYNAASQTGAWFTGTVSSPGGVPTLTATTRIGGALEPGMVLSTPNAPKLIRCVTGCSGTSTGTQNDFSGSTWVLSNNLDNGATGSMRADPIGGAPWPNFNVQTNGATSGLYGTSVAFAANLIKPSTLTITDTDPATGIATTVCQDTQAFAYNQTGGNCTGTNIASSFVNYQTGDYQITFTSGHAPTSLHALSALWTNTLASDGVASTFSRPQNLDYFGDGTCQSGAFSSLFCKAPGGVNGHIFGAEGTDFSLIIGSLGPAAQQGYQYGALGYSQMISWLYGTRFPALIPGNNPGAQFMVAGMYRIDGPSGFANPIQALQNPGLYDAWTQDVATSSTFSGSVASSVLTLSADSVGPVWEGEVVGCVTFSGGCTIGPLSGVYITGLTGGAWGKNGSTYAVAGASGITSTGPMQNPVFYSGGGQVSYLGALNDVTVQQFGLVGSTGRSPHPGPNFAGGPRATRRWAAMIYGANGGNASDPKVDRVKANASGCNAAALAAPCFDIGNTFASSHSATMAAASATITVTGGIAAHDLPFVLGQVLSCSGCTAGRVIVGLDVAPTQSTVVGAGEVGQTFHITASGTMGATATEALTAGCSGTSGTGSNCIDVAVSLNVSGTFGTTAALDTCGANNINGTAPNYNYPAGVCQGNGKGELVRAFSIGTNQPTYGNGNSTWPTGSFWDDGVDRVNGAFTQSAAFTCNIASATVVRCVKAPLYVSGLFSSVGQWASGATYIAYGDATLVSGRFGSLVGYVGGQSFPVTAGSGYTNGQQLGVLGTGCGLSAGGTAPRMDITIAGGSVVAAVPSAQTAVPTSAGMGVGTGCTFTPTGGTGGSVGPVAVAPLEGIGGVATFNTEGNTQGMFLYDNSGEPGNPLNSFFTNGMGGYFEPGLPLRQFGQFQGLGVSG